MDLSKIKAALGGILAIIFIVVVSALLFFKIISWLEKSNDATAPMNDAPPIVDNSKIITKELFAGLYVPSHNVYDESVYDKEALKIAINGSFESVILHFQGAVGKNGDHFISLNFGNESGILNAVRKAANQLDISASKQKGGLIEKESIFDIKVDLIGETSMATTRSEFQQTLQPTKVISLWSKMGIMPPTVTRLLIAPFGTNGIYGGAEIKSIKVNYICKENSPCDIATCPANTMTTKCLQDLYGEQAMKSWCSRSKKC